MTFQIDDQRTFWYLFGGPTPYGARAMGPQSRKMALLPKFKMAAGDQIVPRTENLFYQKSFISKSLNLKCAKIFDLRSKPETLEPKN